MNVRPITQRTTRYLFLAVAGAVSVVAVTGCSTSLSSPAQTSSSSPTASATVPATVPWDDPSIPTVAIEFEVDGERHTVTGEIPDGLRSCPEDGMIVIAGKSPEDTLGVSFDAGEGDSAHVGAWAIKGDYAVQVLADGVVESAPAADGGTNYSTVAATGRVSVLPRDPQKTSIGEYDFQGFEQRDGTVSFTVTCP